MKNYWGSWIFSAILATVTNIINIFFFPVKNIIAVEFAASAGSLSTEIEKNDLTDRYNAYYLLEMNTLMDYLFIITYTLLIIYSAKIILGVFDTGIKTWLLILLLLPGFFDCMENVTLFSSGIRRREDFTWLFALIVRTKWMVAILPIMIFIVTVLYGIWLLLRFTPAKSASKQDQPTVS